MSRHLKKTKSNNSPAPLIGEMKGGFTTTFSNGITVSVQGKKLNLDMAPKNEYGTIEVLEIRDDGNVWASGVCYYDPRTDTYFPDQEDDDVETKKKKEDDDEDKDRKPKDSPPLKKSIRKTTKRAPRRKPRVISKDSIGVVGPGCTVNIF